MRIYRRALAFGATALTAFAGPAFAATITVSDISVELGGGATMSIPSVQVTDGNLDEAALRGLFAGGLDNAADTLATFDAAKIVVPELTTITSIEASTSGSQPITSTTTYRDIEITGIANGVASASRFGAMESSSSDGTRFTGDASTALLDLGGIFSFYGFGAAGGDAMRPIYRDLAMRNLKLAGPGFACDIGDATGEEFSGRPLKTSFAELMRLSTEMETAGAAGTPPSPEAVTTFVNYFIDLLTAFESTPTLVAGLNCTGSSEAGNPLAATAGAMTIGSFKPGIYPELVLEDFNVEVQNEGYFNLGNFTWKPMDFAPTIAALESAAASVDVKWLETNWRKLIPAIEGFSFSRLDFDVPDQATKQRVTGTVGNFDLSLSNYVNGVPAQISSVATDVTVPLPESGEGSELRAFGIDTLDLDSEVTLHWDEAAKSILIDRLELAGADMGRLAISGVIGNAGAELFADEVQVATVAALGLTVREVTINIENQGLAPALIAMMAAEQKMAPAEFHIALSGMAQALPLALLGATPEALGLSQALGGFLTGVPEITVTLTSVDPAGITVAEFMAAQNDPNALKGKFTVAASVAGDPVPFTWPEAAPPAKPADPVPPATGGAKVNS